jgi:hypothetical protein
MRCLLLVLWFLVCFSILAGCAGVEKPTPEQIANADYGAVPENYKSAIEEYIKASLIDPDSARFSNWHGPAKGYSYNSNGKPVFGYLVCVYVNSKNRMGGYGGSHPYLFVMKNDRIALIEDVYFVDSHATHYLSYKDKELRERCAQF